MVAANYQNWHVEVDSFALKAQQNFIFAEHARAEGRYDIEANRVYYALHQLACELVRKGLMNVRNPGDRVTPAEPWRIRHGSYYVEIRQVVAVEHVDRTVSGWHSLRQLADYEPGQVCRTEQWKQRIGRLRQQAIVVAEAIYEKLGGQ